MKQMTPDEMIAVIQAYKDGKTIEFKYLNSREDETWHVADPPIWNFFACMYRVKEETEQRYRKYLHVDEVLQAIKKHGGYVKEGNTYRYLKKFTVQENGEIVYSFSGWSSTSVKDWESIHERITWADGAPFGVEVKE